ncbi:uncharacterized protein LOC119629248 [Bombyx mori]|uniref:Uncharacterized protein n=1 Tax=Bombyx mori TaxID=7091 RepID=A0A8R2M0D0_BOMMO|nr:uncharacterized protein LOC119629248 [Bombyx mori]
MDLNPAKCYSIHFSRRKTRSHYNYTINHSIIKEVDSIRDLGVEVDRELRFHVHIEKICSKAFKSLGFVLRNSRDFTRPETKILLYNSYVRSTLEYCSVTWNPFYDVYKKKLERVQKRFLWHLAFSCNVAKTIQSYPARLKYFHMSSLSERRRTLDLLFLHKLVNEEYDAPDLLSLLNFNVPLTSTRASKLMVFRVPRFYTNLASASASRSNGGVPASTHAASNETLQYPQDALSHFQVLNRRLDRRRTPDADALDSNMFIGITSSGDNVNSHYDYLI